MEGIRLECEKKKKSVTKGELCQKLGISRSAFYRKTHGVSEFTQKEIQCIIDVLQLDSPMGIFLPQ